MTLAHTGDSTPSADTEETADQPIKDTASMLAQDSSSTHSEDGATDPGEDSPNEDSHGAESKSSEGATSEASDPAPAPTVVTLEWNGFDCYRPYLIIAAITDNSQHNITWLDDKKHRSFDILALYVGNDPEWSCPECVAVYRRHGFSWQLLRQVSQTSVWPRVTDRYTHIMVADDDLIMSTRAINVAFDVASQYRLALSQPSVCRHPDSYTFWTQVYQDPEKVLRYTAFVELMAPIFDMPTVTSVLLPNLDEDTATGYALDFVWPLLLDYPRDRIGVVDAACMIHPAHQSEKTAIYSLTHPHGWSEWDEDDAVKRKYGLHDEPWFKKGLEEMPGYITFGGVNASQGWNDVGARDHCSGLYSGANLEIHTLPGMDFLAWALVLQVITVTIFCLVKLRRRAKWTGLSASFLGPGPGTCLAAMHDAPTSMGKTVFPTTLA
ncbi:hypothetical protein ACKKBG_A37010 [Auxenochlorella protothecoides x Auxenochlorella symbiontica]